MNGHEGKRTESKGKERAISKEYHPKTGRFHLLPPDCYQSPFEGKGLQRNDGAVMFHIDMP